MINVVLLLFAQMTGKKAVLINVDDIDDRPSSSKDLAGRRTWIEMPLYTLSNDDEAILLSTSGWLNDNLINAAQAVLKHQFQLPVGLQDVSLGRTLAFDIQRSEFIQILHNGSCHWLLVTNIGAEKDCIFVYDSLYPTVNSTTKRQIAALFATPAPRISLQFVDCQVQKGTNDCGLFAIAFATALANGLHPESLSFKQGEMRQHLRTCLITGKMTMFNAVSRKVGKRIKSTDEIPVFCNCRLPEMMPMAECSKCKEWYHTDCVFVPQAALDYASVEWFCTFCC